jgi:7-carboxy-7-deazaguanine synthase
VSDTLIVNEIYLSLQGESTLAGLPCVFVRLTACNLRCSYCDTAYAFTEGTRQPIEDIRAEIHRLAAPFIRSMVSLAVGISATPAIAATPGMSLIPGFSPASEPRQESEAASTASPNDATRTVEAIPSTTAGAATTPRLPLVEFTGGEPLLQKGCVPLMKVLCDDGFTVLLETSGAHDISTVDPRVRRIMDLKCPSSGEVDRNRWDNLEHLRSTDEIKFVIGTVEDYAWAREQIARHALAARCPLLMSWVHPLAAAQQDKSLKPVPRGQTPITRQQLAEHIIADALPVRFQVQLHKVIWPPEQRGV